MHTHSSGQKMANYQHPMIRIVTSKGDMEFELFENIAPNTVANIIQLAESGFYRGMFFHRIIDGFMAQGGCPYTKKSQTGRPGTGGPGYCIADECSPKACHDDRGILSMANAGPDTNGSQFFITFAPTPHLDGAHTVFGKIVQGEDVLSELENVGTPTGNPREQVDFSIEVLHKNAHTYKVEKL